MKLNLIYDIHKAQNVKRNTDSICSRRFSLVKQLRRTNGKALKINCIQYHKSAFPPQYWYRRRSTKDKRPRRSSAFGCSVN